MDRFCQIFTQITRARVYRFRRNFAQIHYGCANFFRLDSIITTLAMVHFGELLLDAWTDFVETWHKNSDIWSISKFYTFRSGHHMWQTSGAAVGGHSASTGKMSFRSAYPLARNQLFKYGPFL